MGPPSPAGGFKDPTSPEGSRKEDLPRRDLPREDAPEGDARSNRLKEYAG